jgi:hypothetical protein
VKFDVLLLIIDATLYIKIAGLSINYPKKIHATCVAHALHRVCRTIRVLYPNVHKIFKDSSELTVLKADMAYIREISVSCHSL